MIKGKKKEEEDALNKVSWERKVRSRAGTEKTQPT